MEHLTDDEFVALMRRVKSLTREIFDDDEHVMNNRDFNSMWEKNLHRINVSDSLKENEYTWIIFYHHYLFLRKLESLRDNRLINELRDTVETKVPYLRLVV